MTVFKLKEWTFKQFGRTLASRRQEAYQEAYPTNLINRNKTKSSETKFSSAQFDPDQKLYQTGIKVLHSPDFDFRTHVYSLRDALLEFDRWMKKHPNGGPIFVLFELKSQSFSPTTVILPEARFWSSDCCLPVCRRRTRRQRG